MPYRPREDPPVPFSRNSVWHNLVPVRKLLAADTSQCVDLQVAWAASLVATRSLLESSADYPALCSSHWSAQYGDGVVGPLIIEGPATSNYDEDLGALPLTDWYYTPAFTLNEVSQHFGPPRPDNLLVNGTHVNPNGGGSYAKMNVVKVWLTILKHWTSLKLYLQGKKYRIRIINTSVDSYFTVSMDGHPFTVITSDFVPIKPWVTDQLTLAIGQRYDVIISANQTVGNYWFRITPGACAANNYVGKIDHIGAILHYKNATDANPTSTGVTLKTTCQDESTANLIPFVPNQVPASVIGSAGHLNLDDDPTNRTINKPFRWLIDGTPHIVDWNNPTLETILAGSQEFGPNSNVHSMQSNGWYLWWIQSTAQIALDHPIHLHGHDFYILDSKDHAVWDGTTTGLNLNNPTRRDTATLPAGGYLLMAFPADNPGMWIMHCHIAWHASEGLSMQFGERYSDLQGGSLQDTSILKRGCDEWDDYWYEGNPNKPYNQTDSGI
jgi:FtsP/CotA-like multicopper oxidase with cupredoxin domain